MIYLLFMLFSGLPFVQADELPLVLEPIKKMVEEVARNSKNEEEFAYNSFVAFTKEDREQLSLYEQKLFLEEAKKVRAK